MGDPKDWDVHFNVAWAAAKLYHVFDLLGSVVFRPVTRFFREVAGGSWLGFALVFMLFFMVTLIRYGARSEKVGVYADGLHYIGKWGLLVSGVYLCLLAGESLVLPMLVLLCYAIENSVSGGEPGLFGLLNLLIRGGTARKAFLTDIGGFYASDYLLLPLGFRPAGLIMVAFGAMFLVSQALGHHRTSTQSG